MTTLLRKPIRLHHDGNPAPAGAVFVFGSNLRGWHGGGAAKHANLSLNYPMGLFEGINDSHTAYGIPTKTGDLETLPIVEISPFVERFVTYSRQNPETSFFVTRVGCVLAGHRDEDMARLFRECGPNCSFAYEWERFL